MRIGAWLLAIIVGVVAVGFAAYRLQQRSAFREKMRPIMEEDLADFAASPSGALMVNDSVSKRQKRIAQVKLYEAGRYREAKSRIVNLMEAENSFLTTAEEMREISDQVQIDESSTKAQQSKRLAVAKSRHRSDVLGPARAKKEDDADDDRRRSDSRATSKGTERTAKRRRGMERCLRLGQMAGA